MWGRAIGCGIEKQANCGARELNSRSPSRTTLTITPSELYGRGTRAAQSSEPRGIVPKRFSSSLQLLNEHIRSWGRYRVLTRSDCRTSCRRSIHAPQRIVHRTRPHVELSILRNASNRLLRSKASRLHNIGMPEALPLPGVRAGGWEHSRDFVG